MYGMLPEPHGLLRKGLNEIRDRPVEIARGMHRHATPFSPIAGELTEDDENGRPYVPSGKVALPISLRGLHHAVDLAPGQQRQRR